MDVEFLIRSYYDGKTPDSIDVFYRDNIDKVYHNVIETLNTFLDIDVTLLQTMSYCFYEILDNALIHSGRPIGTAMTQYDSVEKKLKLLVADDGIGIHKSLTENPKYAHVSEPESLSLVLQDSVTDGKGMGFGLYATTRMMHDVGLQFVIHSGHHKLVIKDGNTELIDNGLWSGTIVYMEINSMKEINPSDIVEHRTNVEEQYNDAFIDTDELEELW